MKYETLFSTLMLGLVLSLTACITTTQPDVPPVVVERPPIVLPSPPSDDIIFPVSSTPVVVTSGYVILWDECWFVSGQQLLMLMDETPVKATKMIKLQICTDAGYILHPSIVTEIRGNKIVLKE